MQLPVSFFPFACCDLFQRNMAVWQRYVSIGSGIKVQPAGSPEPYDIREHRAFCVPVHAQAKKKVTTTLSVRVQKPRHGKSSHQLGDVIDMVRNAKLKPCSRS
jgi:hypothetical protein